MLVMVSTGLTTHSTILQLVRISIKGRDFSDKGLSKTGQTSQQRTIASVSIIQRSIVYRREIVKPHPIANHSCYLQIGVSKP